MFEHQMVCENFEAEGEFDWILRDRKLKLVALVSPPGYKKEEYKCLMLITNIFLQWIYPKSLSGRTTSTHFFSLRLP